MNTMVSSPSARRRIRARSPSEDEETLVYARHAVVAAQAFAKPSDRVLFNEIMQQLALPSKLPVVRAPPLFRPRLPQATPPNVFLIPWAPGDPPLPWATPVPALSAKRSAMQTRTRTRRRTAITSLIFLMSFGIAYGLVRDPVARAATAAQLRGAAHQAASVLRLVRR